ncbi:hypothetical protein VCHA51O444_10356 [Vibrio chagasii]|nr:hypothetical protein VCHA51O444_10356 [Vibrio chagasii]
MITDFKKSIKASEALSPVRLFAIEFIRGVGMYLKGFLKSNKLSPIGGCSGKNPELKYTSDRLQRVSKYGRNWIPNVLQKVLGFRLEKFIRMSL